MKILPGLVMLALSSLPVLAVSIGDSYEQVIAEKGVPSNKIEMGDVQVLTYPGQRIKLKGKTVTEIKGASAESPPAASAPVPAAPKAPARPPAESAAVYWETDYGAAMEQARAKKSRVFLFFTGSDWCGWCKRLDAEILSTPEFKGYAVQNLILVKLDFPRQIPQSDEVKAQNARLAKRFKIEGYPTVIVLNSNGKKVGELGYQKGGPGPFIEALKRF